MPFLRDLYLSAGLCLAVTISYAQSADTLSGKLANFPSRIFSRIQSQSVSLNQQLTHQTVKYLRQMGRQEEKLKAQIYRRDSVQAARLYPNDPQQQYAALAQKFKKDSSKAFASMGPEYLPYADSTHGALAFLNKNPTLINASPALQAKMQGAQAQLQQLQARLQQADVIKQYIASRKAQIQQYLHTCSHLPSGITNAFQGYNQQAYYYADQVREYRQMLNDPDRMMQTALGLLNKVPAFTNFMKKNGFLAGLFSVPPGYGTDKGMVGLQTRSQVLAMVKSAVGQGGANGLSSVQQSLQTAQQDISKLQNKLSSLGAGSGGMDIPNFRVNDQKKKSFLGRLEVGVNVQTSPATDYYVSTANLGVSLGYNLGHNNMVGIGAAYKLGLGEGFQHIALSSQGVGLRSFLNVTVKKTWGVMGGFEYNYQQPFASYQDIRNLSAWTKSGLIGITKTVSIHSAVFRKTQVQLLWDFLSYSQIPRTSPVLFRVAYSF